MMMAEIIKELITIRTISDIISEQVLELAERVAILTSIQDNNEFNIMKCMRQNNEKINNSQTMSRKRYNIVVWNIS